MTKREIHVAAVATILRTVEREDLSDTDLPICDEVRCMECPLYNCKKDRMESIDKECFALVQDVRDWWFRNVIERHV